MLQPSPDRHQSSRLRARCLLFAALLLLLPACGCGGKSAGQPSAPAPAPEPPHLAAEPPTIDSVDPARARVGEAVRIQGQGLSTATVVAIDGVPAPFAALPEPGVLEVTVPSGATLGAIAVQTPQGPAAARFAVLPAPPEERPAISRVYPLSGFPGDEVAIVGPGLAAATAVDFNGVTAVPVVGPTGLTVTVPAGARTGPLEVVLGEATRIRSRRDFTVLAPAAARPSVDRVEPASALAGATVTVTGTHLDLVLAARVGGVPVRVQRASPNRFTFPAPAFPAGGRLIVFSANGRTLTGQTFTTLEPEPRIRRLSPERGQAGTPVLILGRNLAGTTSVAFGPVSTRRILDATPTSIRVEVPERAPAGPVAVTVTTPAGSHTVEAGFTVAEAPAATKVVVAAAYITQATQTLDGKIPLVAGRDGVLRVFLEANRANRLRPRVRVRLRGGNPARQLLDQVVQPEAAGVPTQVDEYRLRQSCNVFVNGDLITAPALSMKVELLPEPGMPGAAWPVGERWKALRALTLPPLRVNLIPIRWQMGRSGLQATGNIARGGRSLESWAESVNAQYPVSGVQLTLGETYSCDLPPDYRSRLGRDRRNAVISALDEARQAAGDPLVYYYGVYPYNHDGKFGLTLAPRVSELGQLVDRTCVGHDALGQVDGRNYPQTLAHELGHAIGLDHSPCLGEAKVDPNYPHANATLGSAGFNVRRRRPIDPQFHRDLMSYCSPRWVSDYTYLRLLQGRQADQRRGRADDGPVPALLVSGSIDGDTVTLDPAMTLPCPVREPGKGPCRLTGFDAAGVQLFQVPFATQAAEDDSDDDLGDDAPAEFSLTLGLAPDVLARLAMLKVTTPSGASAVRTARPASAPPVREPVATRMEPKVVHLGWDHGAYPRVMVRNPRTGSFIGNGVTGSLDLETDAAELDLYFSDGVRTITRKVPVR